MTADLVIHGGTIVSPDASYAASIAIKDGVILAIGAADAMPAATETLDATGLHILPGAIDVHVHFRDPGYPQKEDFASGRTYSVDDVRAHTDALIRSLRAKHAITP